MIKVTEEALAHAANQLADEGAPKGSVIRVAAYQSGVVLTTGPAEPGDELHEHDGCPVIAISAVRAGK